jgi:hypothetical protein
LTPFVETISSGLAFTDERATNSPFPYVTDFHEPVGTGYSVHVAPSGDTATSGVSPSAIHRPLAKSTADQLPTGEGADATFQAVKVDELVAPVAGNAVRQSEAINVAITAVTLHRVAGGLVNSLPFLYH